ncbi:MAG TPA: bifunctional aldolase/short-chain dehydrogenase [Vicinamibacterales bacterium]|nr:bifunctional aldolase/short-chain dehydrogenase [Acidobacteriota bacterium]HOC17047.1 bifunctional aldolase/short-chain dehydrogenase [Vicinamibacterales bacterium]
MKSLWSETEARRFVDLHGPAWGEALALRTYSARLLGAEPGLVLHGGGNTSVKAETSDVFGDRHEALFVKASGADLAAIGPDGHVCLALGPLRRLRALDRLGDDEMVWELRRQLLRAGAGAPSIEALVHAFLPHRFIDHTHADAVLALTNRAGGEALAGEVLGDGVIVMPYAEPGFELAKAAADAFEAAPAARAMVWARHGLVTWGRDARESYEATIELVSRAEACLTGRARARVVSADQAARTREGIADAAPVLRGLLAGPRDEATGRRRRVVVRALATADVLELLESPGMREAALAGPLTSDHLIRTGPWPAWATLEAAGGGPAIADVFRSAIGAYAARYRDYLQRHASMMPRELDAFEALPRVVLAPGLGAFCAGRDLRDAEIARDITAHTLAVKASIAGSGTYEGLPERDLFHMEYRTLQHAKLAGREGGALTGEVAIVTGAAGAIGSGICRALLEAGCLVAATDLPGPGLESLVTELSEVFGPAIIGVPMDVTDAGAVGEAWRRVVEEWGGVDLVVVNAGIAHVSSLATMDLSAFRRLERVNVEGTLLVLGEAARLFERQGSGGDVVLVSTKNVFAPGAKFGAYSATKAASHQLARIASLELAGLDVRVNMVAPDAVFSDGSRKSGLWAEVGPDRMRARGLDEAGLEAYYRSRNLLKAPVTARHVANAVLFFATRQTPTTGATIPVDGGLPDATPR